MGNKDFESISQMTARIDGEYWRIAKEVEEKKCVFCDLKEKYVIKENNSASLTVNLFPYINGQLLVIPNRHIVDISEVTKKEVEAIHDLCNQGVDLLKESLGVDDVWIILRNGNVAGKTVKHLHWNIMPYVEGINTWNYQQITIPPLELARKLRKEE